MVAVQIPRFTFNICSSNNAFHNFVRLSIGLVVVGLFFWIYIFSQTVQVTHAPPNSIPILHASGSSFERQRLASIESVEGDDDAAKKRAMDLESAKQNRIQKEHIMRISASTIRDIEHLVNQTPSLYYPPSEWNNFPDIWILGCAKAGTSQLYQILTHHPDLQPFHPRKEFCMDPSRLLNFSQPNEKLYSSLYSFHGFMNSNTSKPVSTGSKPTVNACLFAKENLLHYMYIQKYYLNASSYLDRKKFIIIFRDPADLLFSNFNFHSFSSFDVIGKRSVKSWSYESLDYRSPELFHEAMVSGNKSSLGRKLIDKFEECFGFFLAWMRLVGRENILVLKNEDMLQETINSRGGLLDQLSSFLAIDRNSYDPEILKSRTNCNDGNMTSRGMDAKCTKEGKNKNHRTSFSFYAISGNRAMLPETRDLIYLIASEVCHLIKEYFDHVVYDGCMKMLVNTRRINS